MGEKLNYTNSIFECSWWLDAVAFGNWNEIQLEDEGKIIARWPYVIEGSNIKIPKYTQTLGIWFSEEILRSDHNYNKRKELTIELINRLPKTSNVKINLDPSNDYFMPFYWEGFKISPKITYRINSLDDLGMVYSSFSKNTKRDIQHAKKLLQIKVIDNIEILIDLIIKNYSSQNRVYVVKPEQIRRIYNSCVMNNACKLMTAVDNENNVHSIALFVFDKRNCYYLLAGSEPKLNSKSCANSLIIWEGIKFASTVSKSFDFEGSMVQSIEKFFRKFGATPTTYYEIRKQTYLKQLFEITKPIIKKILKHK